ncbi:hypothetical protein V8C86DRAFT_2986052 [Haematococcus lacustris]
MLHAPELINRHLSCSAVARTRTRPGAPDLPACLPASACASATPLPSQGLPQTYTAKGRPPSQGLLQRHPPYTAAPISQQPSACLASGPLWGIGAGVSLGSGSAWPTPDLHQLLTTACHHTRPAPPHHLPAPVQLHTARPHPQPAASLHGLRCALTADCGATAQLRKKRLAAAGSNWQQPAGLEPQPTTAPQPHSPHCRLHGRGRSRPALANPLPA